MKHKIKQPDVYCPNCHKPMVSLEECNDEAYKFIRVCIDSEGCGYIVGPDMSVYYYLNELMR